MDGNFGSEKGCMNISNIVDKILLPISVLMVVGSVIIFNNAEARSSKPVRQFVFAHACPATGKFERHCPGYVVDHVVPLCAGGPDKPENM